MFVETMHQFHLPGTTKIDFSMLYSRIRLWRQLSLFVTTGVRYNYVDLCI